MAQNYIILLPPSEGKNKGGNEKLPYRLVENISRYNSFLTLNNLRGEIYENLLLTISQKSEEEMGKILELKGKNLHNTIDNIQDMLNLPTEPAIERFSGVMFKSINYDSLDLNQRTNFDESVLFVDGFFGLLRPKDYIPEYKLKITSKFNEIDCTKFWKEHLPGLFNYLLKEKVVIDMLPLAHRKILTYPNSSQHIEISFASVKNGKLTEVGHLSKQLKGELVKYILNEEKITREYLEGFVHTKGYKYSKEHSSINKIVYLSK